MTGEKLPGVVDIALDVSARLEQLGVSSLLAGSLASAVYGEPRTTMDVDLVVGLRPADVDALVHALQDDYYVDPDVARDAATAGGTFNAVHRRAGIKVDFFVAGTDAFDLARLQDRQPIQVGEPPRTVWVDTAEHTLVRKLEWYRRGGEVSERQWRDVLAIVRTQGDRLRRPTMEHWAAQVGVGDLLRRCLDGM
ncbi:MAG: hypothetical protein KF709_11325 [Gemmatimonadaceae bacterium]|nr:hypothetical protein [Gemmatimonadaceae bacterium]